MKHKFKVGQKVRIVPHKSKGNHCREFYRDKGKVAIINSISEHSVRIIAPNLNGPYGVWSTTFDAIEPIRGQMLFPFMEE